MSQRCSRDKVPPKLGVGAGSASAGSESYRSPPVERFVSGAGRRVVAAVVPRAQCRSAFGRGEDVYTLGGWSHLVLALMIVGNPSSGGPSMIRLCQRHGCSKLMFGALFLVLGPCVAPAGATGTPSSAPTPLSASNYTVRQVCAAPLPGQASCMAEELVPQTAEARSHAHPLGMVTPQEAGSVASAGAAAQGSYGLRPQDLHSAYELPANAPTVQTIALVDGYDDPTAEADLKVYDEEFHLPACTTANHCFSKINQEGQSSPLPETEGDWATEISLDIETAHATCQNCHILLVEAKTSYWNDLEAAEERAVADGATEISNSYGAPSSYDGGAYDHPGVVITAASGDGGYDNWGTPFLAASANYPASSPDVVAVGGTELNVENGTWESETAWDEGGSGCSAFVAPSWQQALANWSDVGCGTNRAVTDVSADADPYTGVAVYDSTPYPPYGTPGWKTLGGTSVASPIVAAVFALAGGAGGVEYPAQTLYSHLGSSSLHDVVSGSNWSCSTVDEFGSPDCTAAEYEANCERELICNAAQGYDGPTGVGSPNGLGAFRPTPGETAPSVASLTPQEGPTKGGTVVTIRGTNLSKASAVQFGNTRARIIKDTAGAITAVSPEHAPAIVAVTVASATDVRSPESGADHFRYVAPPLRHPKAHTRSTTVERSAGQ